MDMQARMWAITHLQEIRPKAKFSGGRKTDFAKQMKLVEGAFETPAVSARQKLQELQHYFEGPAYDLVETDVLREDAETALSDAIGKLNRTAGLCFRCLEKGHAARFCLEEGKCNMCSQTHHPLLHAVFSSAGGIKWRDKAGGECVTSGGGPWRCFQDRMRQRGVAADCPSVR